MDNRHPKRATVLARFFSYVIHDKWNLWFIGLGVAVAVLVCLALLGLLWERERFEWFWTFTEPVTGLAVLIGIFLGWIVNVFNGIERETEIEIVLKRYGRSDRLKLPYRPLRSQLSRAEISGILGMYYGQARYETRGLRRSLEPQSESEESMLNAVLRGKRDDLEVEVTGEVFDAIEAVLREDQTDEQRPLDDGA